MAVAFRIDARHLTAEELPVRRSVAELVDRDIIMNHLMKDGVLDECFRQVNAGIDAEDEVLVLETAEESLLAPDKGKFAKETLRVGEFDRDMRKRTAKETGVEVVKTGLYVFNRRSQFRISNFKFMIFKI